MVVSFQRVIIGLRVYRQQQRECYRFLGVDEIIESLLRSGTEARFWDFATARGVRFAPAVLPPCGLEWFEVAMKTLANPKDKDEILRRLRAISPASRRQWGKMSAHQMICHLSDAFRSGMGEKAVAPVRSRIPRPLFRWTALWIPLPWPHGVRAPREWDQMIGGTPPGEFEDDLGELRKLLDRVTRQPRDFQWAPHPHFGRMSDAEWLRLGYRHLDHHLRQFGA